MTQITKATKADLDTVYVVMPATKYVQLNRIYKDEHLAKAVVSFPVFVCRHTIKTFQQMETNDFEIPIL